MKKRLEDLLIQGLGGALLNGLLRSCSYEVVRGREVAEQWIRGRRAAVYVLWHGRLLPCSYACRHMGIATVVSQNRDGDHITAVVERWGYEVIRGSSSRGGTGALAGIVRTLRRGVPVAITPDGPRGPRQKMKEGPIRAARLAGVPVIAVTAGASSAWYFGRWDRFLVPRPFARIVLGCSDPIFLGEAVSKEEEEQQLRDIERLLNALTEEVDGAAARVPRG
jgi:lysophospholipid acyltransferase (LPLAT)-like uncharacterized protein